MTASDRARELVRIAARAADAKKAEDLVALDVSGPLPLTDAFLLATGDNERNVLAIAGGVEDALIEAGFGVEPRVVEHTQHLGVVGGDDRDEPFDAGMACPVREVLEEQRPHAPALEAVRDRHGHFRVGRVANPVAARHTHQLAA